MKTVNVIVKSVKAAERAELVVRIAYWIILTVLQCIFGIVAALFWIVQLIVVLLTATRNAGINDYLVSYITWTTQIAAYMSLATDERPQLTPL
jgi:hypothetical protein